jgi:hypothetical protein
MINIIFKNIGKLLVIFIAVFFIAISFVTVASAQTLESYDAFETDFYSSTDTEMTIDAIRFESDDKSWIINYEANSQPESIVINKNIVEGLLIVMGVYIFFSMLAVILVLALIFPRQLEYASATSRKKFWKTNAYGLIVAIAVPWLIFLLFITLIGIPLAGIVIVLALAGGFLSGPFAGYAIGHMLVPTKPPLLKALIGGVILLTLYFVPFINLIALSGAYIYGSGMLVNLYLGYRLNDE